ncbi:MAG: hypothetical protein RLZZ244_2877, partial [Verrucomicrobiota bacterium]
PQAHALDADFFTQKVEPILRSRCFECHSHAHKIKGGLSLDYRSGWEKGGDSGAALLPGKPEDSLLIQAIRHADKDLAMPPKEKLPEEEIALLTQWVQQGAPDPRANTPKRATDLEVGRQHWAYRPVTAPPGPPSAFPEISTHPIDAFVFASLKAQGLTPSPLADRLSLLRRATYDLTGLPPEAASIQAFLADPRTDSEAFTAVLERLLDSPAYGERWGRHWLDLAHYADTTGCSSDWPVDDAWRYRDWVVRAFQKDMPLSAFLTAQIAGDLLARDLLQSTNPPDREAYRDHRIATGFLASSKRFGSNPNGFEHLTIADTLDFAWKALQGIAMGCARCHDHKFEPITAKDYYALYGIFASSHYPYAGSELNQHSSVLAPLDPSPEAAPLASWNRRVVSSAGLRKTSARTVQSLDSTAWDFEEGERSEPIEARMPGSPWIIQGEARVHRGDNSPFDHLLPLGSQVVEFPPTGASARMQRRVRWPESSGSVRSIALDFKLLPEWNASRAGLRFGWKSAHTPDTELALGTLEGQSLRVPGAAPVPLDPNQWYHAAFTAEAHTLTLRVWTASGTLTAERTIQEPAFEALHGPGDVLLHFTAQNPTQKQTPCIRLDNLVCLAQPLDAPQATHPPQSEPQPEASLLFAQKPPTAFAMGEGTPHDVPVQKRGEPQTPLGVVPRRNLALFGAEPVREPLLESGRRDLARWLAEDSNPLTHRVYVNRLWLWHFGRGIVPTPNDFGHTGSLPSHPELLDYLVQRLRHHQLSTKALHREIMLSHTYRQSARPSPEAMEKDPDNTWLSHFSARRLSAEEIRDSVLAVSGLLDRQGPGHRHPFPPLEARTWSQHRPFTLDYESHYAQYEHHKRSLYLPITRLLPDPFLSTFDGGDSNQSTPSRSETAVPLQPLALMNAPFLVQAADQLARSASPASSDPEALQLLYGQIFGTPLPAPLERKLCTHLAHLSAASPMRRQEALAVIAQSLLSANAFLYLE